MAAKPDTYFSNAVTNTAAAVKTSGGRLRHLHAANTTAAIAYVQFFNLATASVTVGTTAPKLAYMMPASSNVTIDFGDKGVEFDTAITIAVATTATGNTAAGSLPAISILYN